MKRLFQKPIIQAQEVKYFIFFKCELCCHFWLWEAVLEILLLL